MKAHPRKILLLGAGFSRNWGGWLAAEAFEYLLGHPQIDKPVRDLLWRHRFSGFEAALGELQSIGGQDERSIKMHLALSDMYSDMEQAFERIHFNFQNEMKSSIIDFLWEFDAIFTLNQDLLLERFYIAETSNGLGYSPGRAVGHIPGVTKIRGTENLFRGIGAFVPVEEPFQTHKNSQPYFKLHGSANWKTNLGGEILILGGQKETLISKFPLLDWYSREFQASLEVENTRLMVIGYSFSDPHINRALRTAVKSRGLKFFVVDPLGSDVIDKRRSIRGVGVYEPDDELVELWPGLIGASRRDLRSIFERDRVEYQKLMRFFK